MIKKSGSTMADYAVLDLDWWLEKKHKGTCACMLKTSNGDTERTCDVAIPFCGTVCVCVYVFGGYFLIFLLSLCGLFFLSLSGIHVLPLAN